MKKKSTGKGLMLIGSLRTEGITVYLKQGQMITRSSTSNERRSNTLPQFIQRLKMRHSVALWTTLKDCKTMFTQQPSAHSNFLSLANRLPALYVIKSLMQKASFLMPGIPVSDGTLPPVQVQLGEVNGVPALLTDLKEGEFFNEEKLWLYTAVQDKQTVRFSMREFRRTDMKVSDGHYVLKGEEFADEMKGWALVRVIGDRCSSQGIVTRCTVYKKYTTDEAFNESVKSYGGLTERK
jgi:hypothetical protein